MPIAIRILALKTTVETDEPEQSRSLEKRQDLTRESLSLLI